MIEKVLPAVAQGCSKLTNQALNCANSAQGNINKARNAVEALSSSIESAAQLQEKMTNQRAKRFVEKSLCQDTSFQKAVESYRQKLIDSNFEGTSGLVRRINSTFWPTAFPSGTKITFNKSNMNKIKSQLEKGEKELYLKMPGKSEDTIEALFIPNKDHLGEKCYRALFTRTLSTGQKEKIGASYFPKSNEIRLSSTDINGVKSFISILGDESGAKIRNSKSGKIMSVQELKEKSAQQAKDVFTKRNKVI